MINISVSNNPDILWNERLLNSGYGTNRQSVETSLRFKKTGKTPFFIKFEDPSGKIIGQLLISTFNRFSNKSAMRKLLGKISKQKQIICQWEYGPIIFDKTYSAVIYEKLGEYLLSKSYFVTGWQHPLLTDGISILEKKFQLIPWSTFMIDLSQSLDTLFQRIDKKSGQKNIRRSQNRNVMIEKIDESNLPDFLYLRNSMKEKQGIATNSLDNFYHWWKLMKPIGLSGFLARKDREAIGGLLFSHVDNQIIEIAVARSELDTKEKLYSQDLIKWKIIEWGHKNGLKYYNLAGFNPNPVDEKELGIFTYKKKWGGTKYDYFGLKSL